MMRISTKGRYSLEALLYLALSANKEADYSSTREIASATGYSEGYLEQLFIPLRKAGLIKGARGPQGGYCLGKDADKISAGDILRAAEGDITPAGCVGESADICPKSAQCGSRITWDTLYRCISKTADSITLASLAAAYNNADYESEYVI